MTQKRLAFLHALTALHSGTGQGVGSIDLPIARERATNLPVVPGSSIKGCLRDGLALGDDEKQAIFGPERGGGKEGDYAGALRISDGQLLLLPVRCLGSTFVWTTCPFVLRRFRRDAEAAGFKDVPEIPVVAEFHARLSSADPLVTIDKKKRLVLEELDFEVDAEADDKWRGWIAERLFPGKDEPWREEMRKRFAIIDDVNFSHLSEFATEVCAHIAINKKTGTVESGALWYQEALPAETVLSLLLQADKPRKRESKLADGNAVLAKIPETASVQFGGKATTGMGVARLVPVGGVR